MIARHRLLPLLHQSAAALSVAALIFVAPVEASNREATPAADEVSYVETPVTPVQENIPALLTNLASAWERGDWAAMETLVANPVTLDEVPTVFGVFGVPSGLFDTLEAARSAYSDVSIELNSGYVSDDWAVATGYFSATYTGQLEFLPPGQGEFFQFPFAAIFQLQDGLISKISFYYNLSSILADTGLLSRDVLLPSGVFVSVDPEEFEATPTSGS